LCRWRFALSCAFYCLPPELFQVVRLNLFGRFGRFGTALHRVDGCKAKDNRLSDIAVDVRRLAVPEANALHRAGVLNGSVPLPGRLDE